MEYVHIVWDHYHHTGLCLGYLFLCYLRKFTRGKVHNDHFCNERLDEGNEGLVSRVVLDVVIAVGRVAELHYVSVL